MQRLEFPQDKKILIIAPHPDDEIFCCSGIIMNYAKQCDILLLSYGEKGNPGWSEYRSAKIRKEEFYNVMRRLKVHKYVELKMPDRKIKEKSSMLKKIPYERYDYIFLPNRYDSHPDHNCVYGVVSKEVYKKKSNIKLYEYEMWGMLRRPTHYIDISDKIEKKKELIMLYKSQEMHVNYCDRVLALNYFRAIEVPQAHYIECFYENTKKTMHGMHLLTWVNERIKVF